MIEIHNHGPLITRSNFWDSPKGQSGTIHVSVNAGAIRLLMPPQTEAWIEDMTTAKEVIVSRGPWPAMNRADVFEFLFDDNTSTPFALNLSIEAFIDMVPSGSSSADQWILSAWTQPRRGKPHKALERPCWYRIVPHIPWLKSRT